MLAGEQVQHAHSGQGRARLCWHRDGGAYLWERGWDKQRQDSDRMGQSLGLCLLKADPSAATTPQRLAGRCLPQSGSALLGRELMPQLGRPWGSCHYSAALHMW